MKFCNIVRRGLSSAHHGGSRICVVSSASRGIGLEFTKQLLEKDYTEVIALTRNPNSVGLNELSKKYPHNLTVLETNICDDKVFANTTGYVSTLVPRIDLLINTAAVLGNGMSDPGPERKAQDINSDWLSNSFKVNTMGHVLPTVALLPLLKKRSSGDQSFKIVNISARVGSISDNKLGGWYSYRMTKAALNMFTKTLAIETKRHNGIVVSLHPGTTDTELSAPFQKNVSRDKLFSTEYSVMQMLNVIDSLMINDSGKFFAYDRSEIEW